MTAGRAVAIDLRLPGGESGGVPSPHSATDRQYAVFISYRHADNNEMGRKWANWLHEALEGYEIPPDLVGTQNVRGEKVPPSLYPVFRDEEELPADADLGNNICRALDHSGLLVVLCSPRAVQSRFVADEIRYFKEIGKSHAILALMIDGEPNASDDPAKVRQMGPEMECFPDPLRFGGPLGNDPKKIDWTKRTEPIAADVRPGCRPVQGWTSAAAYAEELEREDKLSKSHRAEAVKEYAAQLELAKLKVVAGALGLPLGVLTQRDKAAQLVKARQRAKVLRRWLGVVACLGVLAAGAGWMAWLQLQEATRQLERSRFQEGKFWLEKSALSKEQAQNPAAILLAARALGFHGFGREERPSSEFEELYPSLLNAPIGTDSELEQLRRERVIAARDTAGATFPPGLPLWASPAPTGETRPEMNDGALSPDGATLYTAMDDGSLRTWDLIRGREGLRISAHEVEATSVAASPDATTLASGGEDGTLVILEAGTGSIRHKIKAHDELIRRVAFSPDGQMVATASGDKSVILWDVVSGAALRTLAGHTDEVADVVFSTDGRLLATASSDQTVRIWESDTGKEVQTLKGHTGAVTAAAFLKEGSQVVSSSKDGSLRLWDVTTGDVAEILDTSDSGDVVRVAVAPGGNWVATSGRTGVVTLHDIPNRRLALFTFLHGNEVNGLAFHSEGRRLVTTSRDGMAKMWDVDDGGESFALEQQAAELRVAALSPDHRLVAAGAEDGTVPVFDLGSRQRVAMLEGQNHPVTAVRFSWDGKRIASTAEGGLLTVWDLATARATKTLQGDVSDIRTMAWSPDGALLATASIDQVLTVWDLATGQVRHRESLGDFFAGLVAFSEDGKNLVVAERGMENLLDDSQIEAAAKAVKLWSVPEMKSLTPPPVGQRSQLIAWLARADASVAPDKSLMTSIFERRISILGSGTPPTPPDLVTLVDAGLLTLVDGLVGVATDTHQFTGPPMVFGHSDTFGQLIQSEGDPSVHLRLCAELSQVPMARCIWQNSSGKLDDQARRDYVLLMAKAGRSDEVADAVTKPMLEDPSVAAGLMTLLRSLPADTQARLKESLKNKAPAGWLDNL